MIFLELFLRFCQVGLFSIGGGYAALPLIQEQVVTATGWLTMEQFSDIITISQMTPGPIALNAASFVGIQVGGEMGFLYGTLGAMVATAGCIFPSFVIVLFVAYMYYRYRSLSAINGLLYGIRPAVVSLIASAGLGILTMAFWADGTASFANTDFVSVTLFAVSLTLLRIFKKKLSPIYLILLSGLAGIVIYSFI